MTIPVTFGRPESLPSSCQRLSWKGETLRRRRSSVIPRPTHDFSRVGAEALAPFYGSLSFLVSRRALLGLLPGTGQGLRSKGDTLRRCRSSARFVALSFALLATVAPGASAQPAASIAPAATTPAGGADDARAFATTRALAAALREELAIPGFAVAVGRGDALVGSAAFGLANVELGVAASPGQRFRIGSLSKLVTTSVAARLVDQGRLDLDRPAGALLARFDELPAAWRPITARHLLGHTSGIRHYADEDDVERRDLVHYETVRASLAAFADAPLLSPPGTASHYSTFGFTLLSALLEAAGGADFQTLVASEVAAPLGLETLALDRHDAILAGRVAFYDRPGGAPAGFAANRPAEWLDPSYKWAGGGMVASVEDLVRFGAAHLSPGYLSATTLAALMTPQSLPSGEPLDVGLGWRIGRDAAGRRIAHHSGSQQGCRAFLLLYPDERLVLALVSNLGRIPASPLDRAQGLAAPFLPPPASN